MDEFIKTLKTFGETIIKAETNFKKDANSRKTDDYYAKRIDTLNKIYKQFTDVEQELIISDPNGELAYRTSILDVYERYMSALKAGHDSVKSNNTSSLASNMLNAISQKKSETHAGESDDSELKSAFEKIGELENIISALKLQNSALKVQISDGSNNTDIVRLQSENAGLQDTISQLQQQVSDFDDLKFEKDSIKSQYDALKLNYDRVIYEKRQLQVQLNNSGHNTIQTHTYSANNRLRDDDELFTIRDIVKVIPRFSGNSSELRVFINKCNELWSHVKSGADQARFMTILKNNMSGEAALLLLDESDVDDWESLRDLLNKNFNSDPNHSNNIAMMQSMKQAPNESVEAYCKKIKDILTKLKSSVPHGATKQFWFEHTESHAIQALEDGLHDVKLQSRVVSARKKSFHIASQYAIETESRLKSKANEAISTDRNDKVSKMFCKYCKRTNHTIKDCKLKMKNDETKLPEEQFKCTICKKNSHTTEICYKNPSNPNAKKPVGTEKSATANKLQNSEVIANSDEFQIWMDSEN